MRWTPGVVSIDEVGSGIVLDRPGWELPPEVWTGARNFRFRNTNAIRMSGHEAALGTPTGEPTAIFNVPGASDQTFWLVFNLDKAFAWDSGVENEITNSGGEYSTVNARDWIGTNLAGIPVFTNNVEPPQYWPGLNVSTTLEDVTAWPSGYKCKVIRAFGPYLWALNITEGTTERPHKIIVSSKADPGSLPTSWDVTDPTKDAVQFELTDAKGGELLDGLELGSSFVIYKKNSTHISRFIGGQEIWSRDLLFKTSGILATRCVCPIEKGSKHFVVTQDDIIIHSGTNDAQSVVEGMLRDALFADLDATNYHNSFCFENEFYKEAWFCYPSSGAEFPDRALIYNYGNKKLYFRDINIIAIDRGVIQSSSAETWASASGDWATDTEPWSRNSREGLLFVDPVEGGFFKLDTGLAFGDTAPVAYLERTGLAVVGKDQKGNPKVDFTTRKLVTRIWPKVTGQCNIRMCGQEQQEDAISWSDAQAFDSTTQKFLDFEAVGVFIGIRFEQQANTALTIQGYSINIAPLGGL